MSGEHRCVAYLDQVELAEASVDFLSEGLRLGQQAAFFGWDADDGARPPLEPLVAVGPTERGGVHVTSLDRHFRPDEVPDPEALLLFWVDATRAAQRAGFPGLRAVADTTPWLGLEAQRPRFLRGEHLVDRYGLDHPFALLCACDATALSADALADVAGIHPVADGASSPVRVHAAVAASATLEGEIDAFGVPVLERLLSAVQPAAGETELVIDTGRLDFIEHNGLLALERHAARCAVAVVLQGPPPIVPRLIEVLELTRVRVEARA